VTSFDPSTDLDSDLAFQLLANSPVTLFYRPAILNETTAWLDANGYQIVRLDSRHWGLDAMHDDFARALGFPDHYGRNLDALKDCLRDVVDGDYGWNMKSTGLVIIFNGYERFASAHAREAHVVLDIFSHQSRDASLIGRRLLCLVQTDDPNLALRQVGASAVEWNPTEWPVSARR